MLDARKSIGIGTIETGQSGVQTRWSDQTVQSVGINSGQTRKWLQWLWSYEDRTVWSIDQTVRAYGTAYETAYVAISHKPYQTVIPTTKALDGSVMEQARLNCTTENSTTKLFHNDLEVIKISVPEGKSWIKTLNSRQCYDRANNTMQYNNAYLNLTNLPYVLSADDNKVIVFGCKSLAYMLSDSYIIGCLSTCDVAPKNGSCSGSGCCQADIPKGVNYYQVFFNELFNNSDPRLRTTPCNYVTVMERAAFNFTTAYLTTTKFWDAEERTPVVMEWGISRNTCEQAKTDKAYACVSSNSDCVTNDAGYLCRCSRGYKGNPYVEGGCTGGSVGLVVLVIAATCAYLVRERRNLHRIKKKYFRQHGGMLLFEEMKSKQGSAFKIFSEEELQHATNMFDEKKVIGHGGHGKVYEGVLKSDVQVAVKRCMTINEQHKKEFGKEMLILSQVNHRNIVKLLGCCLEVEVPMLVYEFIPNGTLFQLIHGDHGRHISLSTRLRIAYESAEALSYLHSCASPPILHGDVKSSNILLDGNFTAKVSDFGASILAPTDMSQFVTYVQGTCGYLDPEYMQTWQLTDKSDVYSFGVVILELLTRKKPFDLDGPEDDRSLTMGFLFAMKNNRLMDILDEQIRNDENADVLEEIAELARQCLEMCGINRPSMKEVADKLDRLRKVMQHPWAQENPEELYSLLGDSSVPSTGVVTTEDFTISKKAAMGIEIGR
ncbi:hypothetical protein PR202_gb07976 [Eleusine coracana subsp. coracana]|uniref:Protein kinase domain-containing protein n=1 Tax=Eleusine coracana subsp. coracana TaxID=191504 RepID=A0AAV5EDK0_ELECO|nr:hypothetical protein PR202_gb07976 [Eleusine coracana subsp. coracana]